MRDAAVTYSESADEESLNNTVTEYLAFLASLVLGSNRQSCKHPGKRRNADGYGVRIDRILLQPSVYDDRRYFIGIVLDFS